MAGIVGMFLYLKIVYDPAIKKYTVAQKKYRNLTKDVSKLKNEEISARGIKGLKKRLKELESGLRKTESSLAKDVNMADDLMAMVLRLAEENNLVINNYKSVDETMSEEIIKTLLYKRRYYDIIINGRYNNLVVFLRKIGRLPQLVTVEKVDIKNKAIVENEKLEILLQLSI